MIFTKKATSLRVLSAAVGAAVLGMATPLAVQADITGNIGVYSKYVLRGITNVPESDTPAVQGGLDYSHSSGLYAGYWGSSLDYGTRGTDGAYGGGPSTPNGFESDVYGGYGFKAGPVDLSVGLIQYLYSQINNFNGTELVGSAGWGPVKGGFKYLLADVGWGNEGDTYVTVDFKQALPANFELNATLGYYIYKDSGEFIPVTTNGSGFRHLDIKLSHALGSGAAAGTLGKTGFTPHVSITYIVGGEDRFGAQQSNAVVLALTTLF